MGRMNFAPRMPTIIIALALAGVSAQTIGVWAYVVAGAVLLAGMLVEGI